jgi:hypothetical protein
MRRIFYLKLTRLAPYRQRLIPVYPDWGKTHISVAACRPGPVIDPG